MEGRRKRGKEGEGDEEEERGGRRRGGEREKRVQMRLQKQD